MQISGWCNYFGQMYIAQNRIRWCRQFFKQQFWAFLTQHRKKSDIFEILRSNWFKTHIFYLKIYNRKFDIMWHEVDLTHSVAHLHGVWLQNGLDFFNFACKGDYKSYTACPKNIFFFYFGDLSLPLVTWPWSWPILSITLMLTRYLQ